jgi:MinD superfamily P-loop ATPase
MKKLLILSGKGGTGKTTVAGALIDLFRAKAYADCDVDAPNLHLIIRPTEEAKTTEFYGMDKAEINPDLCVSCDACRTHCRFHAVEVQDGTYRIDPYACEGCAVCTYVCPADAVSMKPAGSGELYLYEGERVFSTARLSMGSGNSGKLVTAVKQQLYAAIDTAATEIVVLDGSPGIGCPVIASMSGADFVLIVTEPSVSGFSDLKRILATAHGFGVKTGVCINRYDVNEAQSDAIESFCKNEGIAFLGRIPYDPNAVRAVNEGIPITKTGGKAAEAMENISLTLSAML